MSAAPLLQTIDLTARFGDRVLYKELNLCLDFDRVALVGRNGVGKSTLLRMLAGSLPVSEGRVFRRCSLAFVEQAVPEEGGSPGEVRRRLLEQALSKGCQMLLLDEPTQDLDEPAVEWLLRELEDWKKGLIVVSHDVRLLRRFHHFFVVSESGCRYLSGDYETLIEELEEEQDVSEKRYLQRLNQLVRSEERTLHIARRRRRKKQYGRVREMDRATPRSCLNHKRSAAQESHGRINKVREERLSEVRKWTRSGRRALAVRLPLEISLPELPEAGPTPVLQCQDLTVRGGGRVLVEGLTLSMSRERVAVVGPNGSGKTSLLSALAGRCAPHSGELVVSQEKVGVVEQGGTNWMLETSLVQYLQGRFSEDEISQALVSQRFPLALGRRPLRSLSPGERVRAALMALLMGTDGMELLVLDEPTYSLDILGQEALVKVLQEWKGGLLISSHQRQFLESLKIDRIITL